MRQLLAALEGRHQQPAGRFLPRHAAVDFKVLLQAVRGVKRDVYGYEPREGRAEAGELVKAEQPGGGADDHGVGDAEGVGETRNPFRFVDAHLGAKVGAVEADARGGGGGEAVADHEHRDADGVVLEVADVDRGELRDGDALEKHHVAHKGAVREAVATVVMRDVHAVVDEGGGEEEDVTVGEEEAVEGGDGGEVHQVGDAEVLLRQKHSFGAAQNEKGADLGHHRLRLDGVEEQSARAVVVKDGETGEQQSVGLEDGGVHDVVVLQRDAVAGVVVGGVVGDVVDLAVEVQPGHSPVGQQRLGGHLAKLRQDLLVLVHAAHAAVDVAQRVQHPRPVHVLHVKDGVAVERVLVGGDVDLVHLGDGRHGVGAGGEAGGKHFADRGRLHHRLERGVGGLGQGGVPPVGGVLGGGRLGDDPLGEGAHRLLLLWALQLAGQHVIVRHKPDGEEVRVARGVQAEREQVKCVHQQRLHPPGRFDVRALVGRLARENV
mmetsp:Transcript_9154/g.16513  ORF Transcript_9154/g.16513 Transcript_9154/m.16513 type:complete len:490 (+) Transcript_9154:255-1724(+)